MGRHGVHGCKAAVQWPFGMVGVYVCGVDDDNGGVVCCVVVVVGIGDAC